MPRNVWGARAALALGYEDYTKNRLPQALNWFAKAKNDTLLREYILFWTAQAKRAQKELAGGVRGSADFPAGISASAMREQFLEAYAPTALDTGHAKEAIEALNAYAPTNTRPALLLERAQAYKAARQLHARRQRLPDALLQISVVGRSESCGDLLATDFSPTWRRVFGTHARNAVAARADNF